MWLKLFSGLNDFLQPKEEIKNEWRVSQAMSVIVYLNLYSFVFVYLCILCICVFYVFVYLCICVFVYLCIGKKGVAGWKLWVEWSLI